MYLKSTFDSSIVFLVQGQHILQLASLENLLDESFVNMLAELLVNILAELLVRMLAKTLVNMLAQALANMLPNPLVNVLARPLANMFTESLVKNGCPNEMSLSRREPYSSDFNHTSEPLSKRQPYSTNFNHCILSMFDPKVTRRLVPRLDP